MNKTYFFLLIILLIGLINARGLVVPEQSINYSQVNGNNSIYWDGNAWVDDRWLETDGSNSMTGDLDVGGNYIVDGKFNKVLNILSTEVYRYGKINFPSGENYIQVGEVGVSNIQNMLFHTNQGFGATQEFTILNSLLGELGFEIYSSNSGGKQFFGRTDAEYSLGKINQRWKDIFISDTINGTDADLLISNINASGDINLNNGNITNVLSLSYNISGCDGEVHDAGYTCYDYDADTLSLTTQTGQVIQIGREVSERGINRNGDLEDGSVVYLSGASGDNPEFKRADGSNVSESSMIGILNTDCLANEICPITVFGFVNDLDTSSWNVGDKLYINSTAPGNLTNIIPELPNNPIWVATVIRSHLNQGRLFVNPTIDPSDGFLINNIWATDSIFAINNVSANRFVLNGTSISDWSEINISGTSGIWDNVSGTATYYGDANITGSLDLGNNLTFGENITFNKEGDDLNIRNKKEDGDIVFYINKEGVEHDFTKIYSDGILSVGSSKQMSVGVQGIMELGGNLTTSIVGAGLGINPTVDGAIFAAVIAQPTINTNSQVQLFRFQPKWGDFNRESTMLLFNPTPHTLNYSNDYAIYKEQGITRSFVAIFEDDASDINYNWFEIGGEVMLGDFGATDNVDYLEEMIVLNGGGSRTSGTLGSINQKGLIFSGFGTNTGLIEGTDSIYAMYADGGRFAHKYDYDGVEQGLFFGAGNSTRQDSGIGYNGTDFIIDPAIIGSGSLIVEGNTTIESNLNVVGSISAGNGYTGYCLNMTYENGIAITCND